MFKGFPRWGAAFSIGAATLALLITGFQNCAQSLPETATATSKNNGAVSSVVLSPAQVVIAPNSKVRIFVAGGDAGGDLSLVSGEGTLDVTTGIYTAPAGETRATVGVQDLEGVWAYATIDVLTAAASLTFSAKPTSVMRGSTAAFQAAGGLAPYTYSVYPESVATIDPATGVLMGVAAGSATVFVIDSNATVAFAPINVTSPTPSGARTLSYTGANQSFVVPAGVTSLRVKLWGGGGGGGGKAAGGGAGHANATISVTAGETLTVVVGGGGSAGNGNSGVRRGGGGGGATAILRGTTVLAVAGGGGGGSGEGTTCAGGAGGGTAGAAAPDCSSGSTNDPATPGRGGTATAAGAAGTGRHANGSPGNGRAGGNGGTSAANVSGAGGWSSFGAGGRSGAWSGEGGGGGGGGGYFGGGGGSADDWGSGGGGGSGYVPAGGSLAGGTNAQPGARNDADRGTAGNGGGVAAAGANGVVRISW